MGFFEIFDKQVAWKLWKLAQKQLFVTAKWKQDWHDGHRVEAYANQVNKLDWRSEKWEEEMLLFLSFSFAFLFSTSTRQFLYTIAIDTMSTRRGSNTSNRKVIKYFLEPLQFFLSFPLEQTTRREEKKHKLISSYSFVVSVYVYFFRSNEKNVHDARMALRKQPTRAENNASARLNWENGRWLWWGIFSTSFTRHKMLLQLVTYLPLGSVTMTMWRSCKNLLFNVFSSFVLAHSARSSSPP